MMFSRPFKFNVGIIYNPENNHTWKFILEMSLFFYFSFCLFIYFGEFPAALLVEKVRT